VITQERLKEVLDFDPVTGKFYWINPTSNRTKKGEISNTPARDGYLRISIDKYKFQAHRLAFLFMVGRLPEHEIDHINRNRKDNSWANLREATRVQNAKNITTPKTNTSGFMGVAFDPRRNKWRAFIRKNGRQFWLGYHTSKEKAIQARINAEIRFSGYFAPRREVDL